MGAAGSLLGAGLAMLTMANISKLLAFLGKLQGFDVLNKSFYGESLPHHLSTDALIFVLISTAVVSLLAGLLPAIKALSMRPAAIMRRE
jgi:lipoprotein-releasing system permease protein